MGEEIEKKRRTSLIELVTPIEETKNYKRIVHIANLNEDPMLSGKILFDL